MLREEFGLIDLKPVRDTAHETRDHYQERDKRNVDSITEVTIAAFETLEISSHTEQFINCGVTFRKSSHGISRRGSGLQLGGAHCFLPVIISDGTRNWYGLGPVSVLPAYQRRALASPDTGRSYTS